MTENFNSFRSGSAGLFLFSTVSVLIPNCYCCCCKFEIKSYCCVLDRICNWLCIWIRNRESLRRNELLEKIYGHSVLGLFIFFVDFDLEFWREKWKRCF